MKTEAAEPTSVIDTSKMSHEQRETLELTEAARETTREGFVSGLFMGRCQMEQIHPYPRQPNGDRDCCREWLPTPWVAWKNVPREE